MQKSNEIGYKNQFIYIKSGWEDEGRIGVALGEPVFVHQYWLPIKWNDEEDPTFHKLAGIGLVQS